jgi:membrane protein implicated in regulation of membrane protease activity
MEFADSWLWLVFLVAGVALAALELLVGVDTGLDLVFIGSAFLVGGFAGWLADSWEVVVLGTGVICVAYVAVGRRYVHRWTAVAKERTNVDAVIGLKGTVLKAIAANGDGIVRVGNEEWRARSAEDVSAGAEITVTSIRGVTLTVEKSVR